jgi:hypothetical protein
MTATRIRPVSLDLKKTFLVFTLNHELEVGGPFFGAPYLCPLTGKMNKPAMDRVLERARHLLPDDARGPDPKLERIEPLLMNIVHQASRELGLRGDRGSRRTLGYFPSRKSHSC